MDKNQHLCLLTVLGLIIVGLIYVTFMIDKKDTSKKSKENFYGGIKNVEMSVNHDEHHLHKHHDEHHDKHQDKHQTQPNLNLMDIFRDSAPKSTNTGEFDTDFSNLNVNQFNEQQQGVGLMDQASMIYNTNNKPLKNELYMKNKKVETIISKVYGKVYNIDSFDELPTRKFQLKMGGKCLQLNKDGSVRMGICNKGAFNTTWNLILIDNLETLIRTIPKQNINRGGSLQCVNFPFYVCVSSQNPSMCLQYDGNNITVRELGNYENQKWDVGFKTIVEEETDGLNDDLESQIDPNKIKINFKIDDDMINNMLSNIHPKLSSLMGGTQHKHKDRHRSSSNNVDLNRQSFFPEDLNETIDNQVNNNVNFIPKNSVGSLCRGCNADKM